MENSLKITTKAGEITILGKLRLPYGEQAGYNVYCKALCFCGKEFYPQLNGIKDGRINSCGCYRVKAVTERFYIHGHAALKNNGKSPTSSTYRTWSRIIQNCYNSNSSCYKYCGDKGIKVSSEWRDSFVAFLADVGEKPNGYRFNRIDKDGDFEPDNCDWVPLKRKSK